MTSVTRSVEAYLIPKNSPAIREAHPASNHYSAGGTSGYPESSADDQPDVPRDGLRGSP